MSSRLTRRALFALPVALPVAAVAAKVAPLASAPKPYATGGYCAYSSAHEVVMAGLRRDLERLMLEGRMGAGRARKLHGLLNHYLAGERSCGGVESRHVSALPESNMTDDSRDPMLRRVGSEQSPSSTRALPPGGEASPQQGFAGVAPGPRDTAAQPVVA